MDNVIKLSIDFIYTLGEPGPCSGNMLNTYEDCIKEVQYELEHATDPFHITVHKE